MKTIDDFINESSKYGIKEKTVQNLSKYFAKNSPNYKIFDENKAIYELELLKIAYEIAIQKKDKQMIMFLLKNIFNYDSKNDKNDNQCPTEHSIKSIEVIYNDSKSKW